MSRTHRKGGKGPGHDYWSKRPGTKKSDDPGKFSKKLNVRLERIENKKVVKKESEDD